jgi:Type II secretion system protein C
VQKRLLLLLDALLLVAAAFLGVRLYGAWASRPPAAPMEAPTATAAEAPPPPAAPATRPPLTEYAVVAERNLFNPTRTETAPEPPRPATSGPPAPPAPKPRLYGIVLLPEGRGRAYLEDVQRRRIFGYSEGDLVGDARLEQIKPDRVVLRRGGETFEVLLYDPSKPRQSAAPPGLQSPETGGAGRPPAARAPTPPPPGAGVRQPPRPRALVPPPAPPPAAEGQEPPTEEE